MVSFKKGTGSGEVLETFSSNANRFFTFLEEADVKELLEKARFSLLELNQINEKDAFPGKGRDLNWLYAFAQKTNTFIL